MSAASKRGRYRQVCPGIWLVGGPDLSDGADCLVYALDLGDTVLVDCGLGPGWPRIKENMAACGLDPSSIHTLVLTHCHADHIGAAAAVKNETGCRVVAHRLDTGVIETGDARRSAARWYGVDIDPVEVDVSMEGGSETLTFSKGELQLIHTPGHTPGSLAAMTQKDGCKVLFGQDIHGPFSAEFESNVSAWRDSMQRLLDLDAEILCEGHFGIFDGADEVRRFILSHLERH